jgi:hypothetical protein
MKPQVHAFTGGHNSQVEAELSLQEIEGGVEDGVLESGVKGNRLIFSASSRFFCPVFSLAWD